MSINHNFWRERRTEADRTEVLLLTSLVLPLGHTGSRLFLLRYQGLYVGSILKTSGRRGRLAQWSVRCARYPVEVVYFIQFFRVDTKLGAESSTLPQCAQHGLRSLRTLKIPCSPFDTRWRNGRWRGNMRLWVKRLCTYRGLLMLEFNVRLLYVAALYVYMSVSDWVSVFILNGEAV